MFLTNKVRPGIHQTVAVMSTRVRELNDTHWQKNERKIKKLNRTEKHFLTLIRIMMKIQKKKMTLRILGWSILRNR